MTSFMHLDTKMNWSCGSVHSIPTCFRRQTGLRSKAWKVLGFGFRDRLAVLILQAVIGKGQCAFTREGSLFASYGSADAQFSAVPVVKHLRDYAGSVSVWINYCLF